MILHPNKRKSSSLEISITLMSGLQITHFELPPNFYNLASQSPIVLDTESLPGKTL